MDPLQPETLGNTTMRKQPNPLDLIPRDPLINATAMIFDFSMSCAVAFVIGFVLLVLA